MDRIDITSIPADRRQEILEDHEDTKTIEIAGSKHRVYLGGGSFDIAKEEGIDLAEVLSAAEEMTEEDPENVENAIDQAAYLLSIGTAPFEESLSPAEAKLKLTFENLEGIMDKVMPQVQGLENGEVQAGKGMRAPAS